MVGPKGVGLHFCTPFVRGGVRPCALVRMPSSIKGPKVKVSLSVASQPIDEEDAINYTAEKVGGIMINDCVDNASNLSTFDF